MLAENSDADIAPISIDRLVERFGHLAAIREALLARDDLAAATRLTLVAKLSETLAGFVAERRWLDADHAQRIVREACEKATVVARRGYADDADARRSSVTCASPGNSPPASFCGRCCPAMSRCSRRLWRS